MVPPVTGSPVETGAARRRELGACLRSYRQLIGPAEVGLPADGRRRTPGLRREEVAALSGVGLSWYTWLEQGRVVASDHVLDAVGRVLRLDDVAREHLRALCTADPDPAPVDAAVFAPLLQSWPDSPAVLLDHRLDMVAGNGSWTRRFGDPRDSDAEHRHVLVPLAGAGEDRLVRSVATQFRMAGNRHAGDPRIAQVRDLLHEEVPHLAPVWDCRGIGAFDAPPVRLDGRPAVAHLLRPAGADRAAVLVLAAAS